ncbi:hypothetical protein COF09_07860 [Bacillus toyonensis]|nr:hypothetical protein COF09_07860 [Bacillus toyonensis]
MQIPLKRENWHLQVKMYKLFVFGYFKILQKQITKTVTRFLAKIIFSAKNSWYLSQINVIAYNFHVFSVKHIMCYSVCSNVFFTFCKKYITIELR